MGRHRSHQSVRQSPGRCSPAFLKGAASSYPIPLHVHICIFFFFWFFSSYLLFFFAPPHPPPPTDQAGSPAAASWNVGDECRCRWSEDGVIYNAVVDEIDAAKDTCTITYTDYGNTETVRTASLLQLHARSELKKPAQQEHQPAPTPTPAPVPAAAAAAAAAAVAPSWKVGDKCSSVHCSDGNKYPAVVETISYDAGTCTVVFDATGGRQYETPLDALEMAAGGGEAPGAAAAAAAAAMEERRAPHQTHSYPEHQSLHPHQPTHDGGPWAAEWAEYHAREQAAAAAPPAPPNNNAYGHEAGVSFGSPSRYPASASASSASSAARRPPTTGRMGTPQSRSHDSSFHAAQHQYPGGDGGGVYADAHSAYARSAYARLPPPPPPQQPADRLASASASPFHPLDHHHQHHRHHQQRPHTTPPPPPQPPHFPSYPPGMPPPANEREESLANMLMAWYQSGFQTGYYVGLSHR